VLWTCGGGRVVGVDNGICRYFIRVSISRRMADVTKEKDLWVHSFRMPPDSNNSIKMEVGIEDCLHIEFEYNKSKCAFPPSFCLDFPIGR
jgi:hypothetical protein